MVVSLGSALKRGMGVQEAMVLPALALPEGYYALPVDGRWETAAFEK